jgi:Cu/Ag efflux protein CusF
MIRSARCLVPVLIVALLAVWTNSALAADAVARGKIKSIEANKKEFVLTDPNGKDWTFDLGDHFTISRGEKEGKFADLKADDDVSVAYDKGITKFTASYILVHEGANKNAELGRGSVKTFDADKKQLVLTDPNGKDWTFHVANDAKVRLNDKDSKVSDLKLGDKVTVVFDKKGDELTARDLCADRK